MRKINVIDLDDTLLPYDSFRKLIKLELKKMDLNVWFWVIFRKMRFISATLFKEMITRLLSKKYSTSYFKSFADRLYKDLNPIIFELVLSKTDVDTINVLLSASPNLYVKELVSLLGWEGQGSYFDDNNFVNLYSINKVLWIENNYPKSEFEYNFAVSDSRTDDVLLNEFNESKKL